MKLEVLVGNAFIELFYSERPMMLTRKQLIQYAEAVTKSRKDFVDLSGASLMELKFNHRKEFIFDEAGNIKAGETLTVIDLESRYRTQLSTQELNALRSINAKQALGIVPPFIKRKTYL